MIDHLTLTVRDYARSKEFYQRVLGALGYGVVMELEDRCAFGPAHRPIFWITPGDAATNPMHLAFEAKRRADVDAFHAAALGQGAEDRGAPGIRAHYHPSYYAGFVFDPDGHPIEAVTHREERAAAKGARRTAAAKRTPARRAAAAPARKAARPAAKKKVSKGRR
jgi:catechol 2,3-dioxygenase-like lactoylglutathione lyase family enzyme